MSDDGENGGQPAPDQPTPEVKTFTQDELNDIIAREKAKVKASFEREQKEQAKKDAEARELERLDGEAKLRKEWEIKERELSERASRAEHDLAVSNVKVSLSAKGYGDIANDIAPYLIGKDQDETDTIVTKFDAMVQKIVAEKVTGSMARGTPPDPAGGVSSTKDELEQALNRAMGL